MKLFLFPLYICFVSIASCQTSPSLTKPTKLTKPVVVELFTSQGCSSCPPAEELLAEMSDKDTNILLLSFHVDYWNRLGWVDTFSNKSFTERQYMYGNIFGLQSVYTPQAVINGRYETVGSNRKNITNFINRKYDYQNIIVNPKVVRQGNKVSLSIDNIPQGDKYQLTALLVKKEAATQINAGENEGLLLRHKNIVMDIKQLNSNNGKVDFALKNTRSNYMVVILASQIDKGEIDDVVVLQL